MRQEDRAFFLSRLTAKTAREGVPSVEQADFTETQTPRSARACWKRVPLTPWTLRLRMWEEGVSKVNVSVLYFLA